MNTSASIFDTIALALLHFLWQGAAIAALAGALMLVLHKPATRYLVGVGALALMLFSFGATISLLSGDTAGEFLTARAPAAALASPKVAAVTSLSMLWTSQAATTSDAFVWMARAWVVGVVVFASRIVFGLLAIERLKRRSLTALPARLVSRFEALQARLGLERVIRYCQCDAVSVPAVIGVFRPVVLLPMRALTGLSAEQLDAVIAHELGHILRFDVAVNFLQVAAETLLFFHPAVWWLNRRIRADREDCCDDIAVAASGSRVTYARALAAMEGWRETPNFAMAATGGTVAARVARLLGVSHVDRSEGVTRAIGAMLVLTTALAVGTLALGFARPALAQVAEPFAPPVAAEPVVPAPEVLPPDPAVPAPEALPPVPAVPDVPVANAKVAPPIPPLPAAAPPEAPRAAKPAKVPKVAKAPKPAKEPKVPKEPKVAKAPKPAKEPKVAKKPKVSREARVDREEEEELRRRGEADAARQIQIAVHEEASKSREENFKEYEEVEMRRRAVADAARQNHAEHEEASTSRDQNREEHEEAEIRHRAEADAARQNHAEGHEETNNNRNQNSNHNSNVNVGEPAERAMLQRYDVAPVYVQHIQATDIHANTQVHIAMKAQDASPDYLGALIDAGIKAGVAEAIRARAMDVSPQAIERAVNLGFKDLTVDKVIQLQSADAL